MKLTANQQELLSRLTVGEETTVLTSEYADAALVRRSLVQSGKPTQRIVYSKSQAVRGLMEKGLLVGSTFWRGATVTRID